MSKVDLCKQFVHATYNEDDEFEIVETLVDLRDEEGPCVFSLKVQCKKPITTPFGICNAHLKTKTGTNLAIKWNRLLEELEIEESDEEQSTEVTEPHDSNQEETPVSEEAVATNSVEPLQEETKQVTFNESLEIVEFDKEQSPSQVSTTPSTSQPAPVEIVEPKEKPAPKQKQKPGPGPKPKEKVVEQKVIKQEEKVVDPKVTKEVETKETKSGEESDSGYARYIPQNSEDETSKSEEPVKPRFRFEKSEWGNFINKETMMVIRPRDRVILGRETENGRIDKLTTEQIEICKKNKFDYILQE